MRNRLAMTRLSFALFTLFCAVALYASAQGASPVPCSQLGRNNSTCQNPIIQGVVDGQWIAVIERYNGTNGGPDRLSVVGIGAGGNGLQTVSLGVIKPEGLGADRMDAWFASDKLYVTNAIYLPDEAHCCFTHRLTRRFGFQGKKLALERLATVSSSASKGAIIAALDRAPSI